MSNKTTGRVGVALSRGQESRGVGGVVADVAPMRVAYADPPYPRCAKFYAEQEEVDYPELLARLARYDGWALSTSVSGLHTVLPLCPPGTRIAAWCKNNAEPRSSINPIWSWEPLIYHQCRRPRGPYLRDYLVCPIEPNWGRRPGPFPWTRGPRAKGRGQGSVVGRKPRAFCLWMFDLLGIAPQDQFEDLYPGTGAVRAAWSEWQAARHVWPLDDAAD